jgi:phage tail sheath protein FI
MPTYLSPGVYVEEVDAGSRPIEGVGTAVAAFVGIAAQGPFNTPTLVSSWRQFVSTFGEFLDDAYLAHSVYGYFLNGGGNCYVVRIGEEGQVEPLKAELPASGDKGADQVRYEVRAQPSAPLGERLEIEISDPAPPTGSGSEGGEGGAEGGSVSGSGGGDNFTLSVLRGGQVVEQFENITGARGRHSAVTVVNQQSQLIQLTDVSGAPAVRPAAGRVALGAEVTLPERLETSDYVGDAADRTGFGGLEAVDDITMIAVPDAMMAYQKGWIDDDGLKAIQLGMIAHCELMGDRVAIIDPPPDLNAQQVLEWRRDGGGYDSKYAATYWPWVKVANPATGTATLVPPSGHMAGIWGRNDDTRGVHKAPANEVVRGAISLGCDITSKEQELLNPQGINCIRAFSGRGIRVWGARTLSSDPAWRYLNIRRLFNYLEESVINGTQWVVFEPNDDALWAKIRRTISAFLVNEWRKGALFGLTPDEAFFVKCDRETNPSEGIDAGQVVCEIGVAPVKPAEFVIFRLSQFSGGASLTE